METRENDTYIMIGRNSSRRRSSWPLISKRFNKLKLDLFKIYLSQIQYSLVGKLFLELPEGFLVDFKPKVLNLGKRDSSLESKVQLFLEHILAAETDPSINKAKDKW